MKYNQKEYILQCHIAAKHEIYFPHILMTAIPNRPGSAKDGFHKKRMGVRAGVSDIALWWRPSFIKDNKKHYGLKPMQAGMIELKVDTESSTAQRKWLCAFDMSGGYTGIARSWKEYYNTLCSWEIEPRERCIYFDEPNYETWDERVDRGIDWAKP